MYLHVRSKCSVLVCDCIWATKNECFWIKYLHSLDSLQNIKTINFTRFFGTKSNMYAFTVYRQSIIAANIPSSCQLISFLCCKVLTWYSDENTFLKSCSLMLPYSYTQVSNCHVYSYYYFCMVFFPIPIFRFYDSHGGSSLFNRTISEVINAKIFILKLGGSACHTGLVS